MPWRVAPILEELRQWNIYTEEELAVEKRKYGGMGGS